MSIRVGLRSMARPPMFAPCLFIAGWSYRKIHKILGTTEGAQTDYQVKVVVHRTTGTDSGEDVYVGTKCLADFGDIRFTKGDCQTLLDYWLEEYAGGVAVFWVELDSIPASPGDAAIYVYYGKSDATTTSSGSNTWFFFDDFSSDPTLTKKVYIVSGRYHGPYWIFSLPSFSLTGHRVCWHVRYLTHKYSRYGTTSLIGVRWDALAADYWCYIRGYGADLSDDTDVVEGNMYQRGDAPLDTGYAIVENVTYRVESKYDAKFKLSVARLDTFAEVVSDSEADYTDRTILYFQPKGYVGDWGDCGFCTYDAVNDRINFDAYRDDAYSGCETTRTSRHTGWLDDVFIGKYADPEPSHGAWGSEESA